MFGTFQLEEERPEYGLTNKIGNRLNPLFLNFHEYQNMIDDIKKADTMKKKWF